LDHFTTGIQVLGASLVVWPFSKTLSAFLFVSELAVTFLFVVHFKYQRQILFHQHVPPNPNGSIADPYLGNVRLSPGGPMEVDYALRFSAGFGSQVCFALYTRLGP
jgi:hypothetical protein